MGIENRADYIAAEIQARADGWTPERVQARENYRARVRGFITGLVVANPTEQAPAYIGYEDNEVVS